MLLEFKVENFLSFKELVTFSMVASSDKEHIETNLIPFNDKLKLLKSAVLYGANASGKTNLFKALIFMRDFVLKSSKESLSTEKIAVEKFRLSTKTEKIPTSFEVTFIIDNTRYRYGFQLDEERVHNEWLFYVPTTREATLFTREKDDIKIGANFKEGKGLEGKTRPNALFLSVTDQFNGEISKKILKWFHDFNIISGIVEEGYVGITVSMLDNKEYKDFSIKLLKVADLGIKEIQKKRLPHKQMGEITVINAIHQKYDDNNKPISDVKFDLIEEESAGTQALFAFAGPIYRTLKEGGILAIDELTSKLHPLLPRAVIEIFHSYRTQTLSGSQPKAQLIFASHDTNILSHRFFRRDQIWFTQKDEYGATDLYSLEEYKVRKDASFNKDYIMGKYGAIPFIGDIESLFQ